MYLIYIYLIYVSDTSAGWYPLQFYQPVFRRKALTNFAEDGDKTFISKAFYFNWCSQIFFLLHG